MLIHIVHVQVRRVSVEKEDVLPVAQQPLKKVDNPVAMGTKDPGWYKQMFQDFQNTVEECYPGGKQVDKTCMCTLIGLVDTHTVL